MVFRVRPTPIRFPTNILYTPLATIPLSNLDLTTPISGLLYSSAGLGPAAGFIAGAAFLQIYIDSPTIDPPASLDVYSQSWLGAWWLGMVIFGVLACITALPVLTFPKRLPKGKPGELPTNPSQSTTLVSHLCLHYSVFARI